MVRIELIQEIHRLHSLYQERFGRDVDYADMPNAVDPQKLVHALRLVCKTGDSVLNGFKALHDLTTPFYNAIESYHISHPSPPNGYVFETPCPLCGRKVHYHKAGHSYEYVCETPLCFQTACRGL